MKSVLLAALVFLAAATDASQAQDSRELVRLMGGQLSVTSKESEGSTFVVELPREAARKTVQPEEHAAAGAA